MTFSLAQELEEIGLIAIIRTDGSADLDRAAEALAAGGIRAMEITLNTPGALPAISSVRSAHSPSMRVGAGTVLNAGDARSAFEAGAEFIVTPTLQPDTIAFCKEHRLPIFCGCMTPTEALTAHTAGADFIKLFPADTLGPAYVRALLAPLPFLKVVPTGGVSLENIAAFIQAGSAGVALGSSLVSKERLNTADWSAIALASRAYVSALQEARAGLEGKEIE